MDYARSFAHNDTIMDFLRQPKVILRFITTFIMMLIFSCVLDKGYVSNVCLYNGKQGACNFTVGISVIAFFVGIFFLVLTFFWDRIQNPVTRKYVVFVDFVYCGFWAFLFFIDFCYITDSWRKTPKAVIPTHAKNNLQFTIICSFVSIVLLAFQSFMAFKEMNDIQNEASGFESGSGNYGGQPFPPHTENAGNYQGPYAS